MSRHRTWYAADAGFCADPKIAELGDRWGPGGPLTIVALHGLAKLGADDGTVRCRWGVLRRYAFLSNGQAQSIVSMAVDLGLLEDYEPNPDEFTARFPHWSRWQKSDGSAAERQRRSREQKNPEEDADVQTLFNYWRNVMEAGRARLTPERSKCIRARLRDNYSVDQIKAAIDGCAASPFHMGDNERRTKYNDLTLICRNGSKLEGFISDEQPPDEPNDGLDEAYR